MEEVGLREVRLRLVGVRLRGVVGIAQNRLLVYSHVSCLYLRIFILFVILPKF